MNEKLQYAEMLEIPMSTCRVSSAPPKKKLFKKKPVVTDQPKLDLVDRVNEGAEGGQEPSPQVIIEGKIDEVVDMPETASAPQTVEDNPIETDGAMEARSGAENDVAVTATNTVSISSRAPKSKKKFKFNIIVAELVAIGVLIVGIFLTNALMPNSAINTLFASIFKSEAPAQVDERLHSEFTAVLPVEQKENITLTDGVMTISGTGSLYAPCDGEVTSMVKGTDGKYTLEIEHSQNFKTVINGVDMVYANVGEKVFSNIPVGYVNSEGTTMCFYGESGAVITDYTIGDDALLWAE